MGKKTILTVSGSGADIFPEIYWEVDKETDLKVVRGLPDLKTEAHGVLLMGGTDISPQLYGEVPTYSYQPDTRRDWLEVNLMQKAHQENLPVLGICRGHQMLAIAHGGKLHQDLEKEKVVSSPHGVRHEIECRMAVLEAHIPTLVVNSYHHQSVKRVPRGFQVAATSLDGVIESIYSEGILGVQWHPENLWESNWRWANLFYWHLRGLRSTDHKPLPKRKTAALSVRKSNTRISLARSQPGWDWLWGEGEDYIVSTRKVQSWDPENVLDLG